MAPPLPVSRVVAAPAPERRPALGWPPREGIDRHLLAGSSEDDILRGFVALVCEWRGGPERAGMRLRQADVAVLVELLGTDREEIERRLIEATACTPETARRIRHLLLAGVGAAVIGLLLAPVADRAAEAAAPGSRGDRPVPLALVHDAEASGAAPVDARADAPVRTAWAPATPAPIPAVPAPPPAPTEASRPTPADATVTIASLGIALPIVAGGQSVIDQGVAAHFYEDGWEAPVPAGSPGTYWLAAHHSTHGGPFNALPDVAVGAEVVVTTNGRTFVYTVTSSETVGLYPGDAAIYGTDPAASVILLQTCLGPDRRVLVHGTLTATR